MRSAEFVALAALMMALFAMSIDMMLPALPDIGADLGVTSGTRTQLVVSTMVAGMAIGQPIYGPISDAIGRKRAIYLGGAVFAAGCLVAALATSFPMLLAGRLLQGAGAAGPRIVTIALIRDQYHGVRMGRVMSGVTAVIMVGPVVAPLIGATILHVSSWRAIFAALLVIGIAALTWFAARQRETLQASQRRSFTFSNTFGAAREICTSHVAMGYAVASGLSLGMLFGWVASAPQVFADTYNLERQFPIIFSAMAPAVAIGSILNGYLIRRVPMTAICESSALLMCATSIVALTVLRDGATPPPAVTIAYAALMLLLLGAQFGNLNTLAMAPLGHIAGSAAGIVGSISWLVASFAGAAIGQNFDGTVRPLIVGFAIGSFVSLLLTRSARGAWTSHGLRIDELSDDDASGRASRSGGHAHHRPRWPSHRTAMAHEAHRRPPDAATTRVRAMRATIRCVEGAENMGNAFARRERAT